MLLLQEHSWSLIFSGELEEAAAIDGCSKGRFFFNMVLPLSKAIIAVLVLYYAVAHWNDYMKGLLYWDLRRALSAAAGNPVNFDSNADGGQ